MPHFQAGTNNPSPRQKRPFHLPSERTGQSPEFLNFPYTDAMQIQIVQPGGGNDWLENRGQTSLGNGRSVGGLWWSNLRFPVRGPLDGKCSAQFWEESCSPLCLSGLGILDPPRGRTEMPNSFQPHAWMDLKLPQKHKRRGAHPAPSAPSCHGIWQGFIFTT